MWDRNASLELPCYFEYGPKDKCLDLGKRWWWYKGKDKKSTTSNQSDFFITKGGPNGIFKASDTTGVSQSTEIFEFDENATSQSCYMYGFLISNGPCTCAQMKLSCQ